MGYLGPHGRRSCRLSQASWPRMPAPRAIIGLDYYMFSRRDPPVALDSGPRHGTGRWTAALMGSVISWYALTDAWLSEVGGGEDPGSWTYDGFRETPKSPSALTMEHDAIRRRTAAPYRPETLEALSAGLDALGHREIVLYLFPVSDAQRKVLADGGLLQDFARWRGDIAALAKHRGVSLLDLADLGALFRSTRPRARTIRLDNLHYTPAIGRLVLQKVGLRSAGWEAGSMQ